MSFQNVTSVSLPIASSAVIAQARFVQINSSGQAEQVDDGDDAEANVPIVGVSLESRVADTGSVEDEQTIPVVLIDQGGIVEIEAGGAVSAGGRVYSGDDGRAYSGTATTAQTPADTYNELGTALSAASAAGEIITVLLGRNQVADGATTTV